MSRAVEIRRLGSADAPPAPSLDHESNEGEQVQGVVVSRVNMSPRFFKELLEAMTDNYGKWTAAESIKNLPEAPGHQ